MQTWFGITALKAKKNELEKIQYEAARIVSGCTKLVSIRDLLSEVGWETLSNRRHKHKLILFYKMFHSLTPQYLSSLLPRTVSQSTPYQLRNSNNLVTLPHRTSLYGSSFLPQTLNSWNSLPPATRNLQTVASFKGALNKDRPKNNPLFYQGERRLQVIHTQLRTKCCPLNHYLYLKNILDSPNCGCGGVESANHFFFTCNLYSHIRPKLLDSIKSITNGQCSLDIILQGDPSKSFQQNLIIFQAVHEFIDQSKRFQQTS